MKDNALYLEVDEDITSAIDKLSKTDGGSVQIVVPKRSTMLQSIINLKLLKKAADNAGKEVVLVTGDKTATELAARVGLAVAPSIGAKPVIHEASMPEALKTNEEIIDANDPEPPPPPPVPKAITSNKKPLLTRRAVSDGPPVAAAAAVTAAAAATNPLESAAAPAASGTGAPAPAASAQGASPAAASGPAGAKALKVPNFGKLQRRVLWVGVAAAVVVGYLAAMYVITSAKVTLYATGTKVSIDTNFTVDPSANTTDTSGAVLAGQLVSVTKDLSGPFTPTGKKDVGTKASGKVVIQNCEDSNVYPLAAGNTLTSQGLNFITGEAIVIPAGTFSGGGKNCTSPTVSVNVTAAENGDKYNLTNATFTSPKLTANFKLTGAQMSGGTTKNVNVVTQTDVDTAQAALLEKDKDNAARDLKGKVPAGYVALSASQATKVDSVSSSPAVDAEATTATLTLKVTYSVLAVKQADYEALLHAQELKQVGDNNQIYDDGLAAAQVTVTGKDAGGKQTFHLTTEAYSGAKLAKDAIAKKIAGERYGDAINTLEGLPGVTRAEITIFPGWVSKLPSRPDKINVTIQVATSK